MYRLIIHKQKTTLLVSGSDVLALFCLLFAKKVPRFYKHLNAFVSTATNFRRYT